MPVRRYRDVSQMPPPPPPSQGELGRRIRVVWARAAAMACFQARPGVQRFRSVEEASEAKERETDERVRQLQAARKAWTD